MPILTVPQTYLFFVIAFSVSVKLFNFFVRFNRSNKWNGRHLESCARVCLSVYLTSGVTTVISANEISCFINQSDSLFVVGAVQSSFSSFSINTSRKMSAAEREFACVIFGASGFTGQFVANEVAKNCNGNFKWAVAGRNKEKLLQVLAATAKETGGYGRPWVTILNLIKFIDISNKVCHTCLKMISLLFKKRVVSAFSCCYP